MSKTGGAAPTITAVIEERDRLLMATPAMIEAGKRTMRTLFLKDCGSEHLWGDALARIYSSMTYAALEDF